jgi:hypothetical protein
VVGLTVKLLLLLLLLNDNCVWLTSTTDASTAATAGATALLCCYLLLCQHQAADLLLHHLEVLYCSCCQPEVTSITKDVRNQSAICAFCVHVRLHVPMHIGESYSGERFKLFPATHAYIIA